MGCDPIVCLLLGCPVSLGLLGLMWASAQWPSQMDMEGEVFEGKKGMMERCQEKEGVKAWRTREGHCVMGLGWVGLDFRGLLPPLFEECHYQQLASQTVASVKKIKKMLHRAPPTLMEHPSLAVIVNVFLNQYSCMLQPKTCEIAKAEE
ncbi:conserved oligomeric Golgi complex subunit 8 [Artemisia annua]|uniref:Conserved oligomeric Golgi complex subunit 8 n=1 Tax=Artemisia annua TaxID=35608 RepID=A0A2U1NU73_ARTAN|nr:conserved oligomeric Golgi complex subunit 8 [Artemisia annua]